MSIRENKILDTYMDQIEKYPRITVEKERELSQIIQTTKDEKKRFNARNELVLANLKLSTKCALKHINRFQKAEDVNVSVMDLIQAGNVALMRAADLFDSNQGFAFSTYAYVTIERRIVREIKLSHFIRVPLTHFKYIAQIGALDEKHNMSDEEIIKKLNITQETLDVVRRNNNKKTSVEDIGDLLDHISVENLSDFNQFDVEKTIDGEDLKHYLFEKMKDLTEKERDVLFYRFFSSEDMSFEKISKKFNLTRERIRQIELSSFRKLRRWISRDKTFMDARKGSR